MRGECPRAPARYGRAGEHIRLSMSGDERIFDQLDDHQPVAERERQRMEGDVGCSGTHRQTEGNCSQEPTLSRRLRR